MPAETSEMEEAFLLFFKGLARNAPGTEEATLTALAACDLPDDPVVYDLGAGTGSSTLVLAEHLKTKVVAVDQLERSLAALATRAERRGIDDWVETRTGDYLELDAEPESVDLMWSEGAIYAAGWEAALDAWEPLLRPAGYLVVSDACWMIDDRPEEAVEFWETEYPTMRTPAEVEELAADRGFQVVKTFELSPRGWADYYGPLSQRVALVNSSGADDAMLSVVESVEREIEMWEEHGHAVNYVFFVLRKST